MTQQFDSKQLNEAQANLIPKSVARSASLQRFNNHNHPPNKENFNNKNKGIQIINSKQNLNKALQEKLNPFNLLNQEKTEYKNTRNHIVNKLLEKCSHDISNQIKGQTKKYSNKITNINSQVQQTASGSNPNCISGFYHKHQNIQKLLTIKEQKQQKELKECTFNPHTNIRRNNLMQKKIDVNHFYQQQTQFLKKKQDKIQQMRSIIQKNKNKENIFHPQTTQRESSKNKIEVYQRLYQKPSAIQNNETQERISVGVAIRRQNSSKNTSNNKKTNFTHKIKSIMGKDQSSNGKNIKCFSQMSIPLNNQSQPTKKSHIFRPNSLKKVSQFQHQKGIISDNQQSSSSNSLLKRIQQNKNLDCQQLLRKNKLKQQQKLIQERKISTQKNRNEQIITSKFIKEAVRVIIKTHIQYYLNYMQLTSFLYNLNFVDKNCSNNERTFISQIWSLLNGQTYECVTILNVLKVLCCIQGATKPRMIDQLINNFLIQSTLEQMQKLIPSKIEHILILQENDPKTIKERFKQLNLNRIRLGQSFLLKQNIKQEYSFKPIISQTSSQLAQRYRQRILQQSQYLLNQNKIAFNIPQGGYISHSELLLLDQKRRVQKLNQMRQEKNIEQQAIQQQSMIQYQQSVMKTESSQISKKKQSCFEEPSSIYSVKKINQKISSQKSIQKQNQSLSKDNNYQAQILDEQYNQQSFKLAQKQIRKDINKSQNQSNCPLLYLNVNMQGNQNTKIPVFKNDTLKTMTEKVRVIMRIQDGEQERNKLANILKAQIQPILIKMGLQNSMQIVD